MMDYDKLPKVAGVLDDYRVVVNRGEKDGVKAGQRYLLFALGDEVCDPDSGKSLGALEVVKGIGRVVHLQETMCTVKSVETHKVYRDSFTGMGREQEVILAFSDPAIGDYARPI